MAKIVGAPDRGDPAGPGLELGCKERSKNWPIIEGSVANTYLVDEHQASPVAGPVPAIFPDQESQFILIYPRLIN